MTVEVTREELAQLLGLESDADDETLLAALRGENARKEGADEASREETLVAEDRQIVAAAVAARKVPASRGQHYLNAMKKDRASIRAMINALTPVPQPGDNLSGASFGGLEPPSINAVETTAGAVEAQLYADPELHRATWQIAGRQGMKPPAKRITYWQSPDAPYIATNADGTGQWVDPSIEQRTAAMDKLAAQDRALREQQEARDMQARASYIDEKRKWD